MAHDESGKDAWGYDAGEGLGAWDRSTAGAGSQVVARGSDGKGGRESTADTSRGFSRVPCVWRGSSSWWTGLRGQGTLVTLGSMVWGARREGPTESEGPRVRGDQRTRWQPTGGLGSFWFESSSP